MLLNALDQGSLVLTYEFLTIICLKVPCLSLYYPSLSSLKCSWGQVQMTHTKRKPYERPRLFILEQAPVESKNLASKLHYNVEQDYFYLPLIFLESFTGPAVVLKIGPYELTMPLDWCCIVGDPEGPEMEILPLTSLNDRGFKTFCFNPISGFRPEFLEIDIIDVYQDVKWYFPKMKPGQLLCTQIGRAHV